MRTVRYHPEARAEFLHEVEYYAAISTRLAEHYDRAVHTAETHAATTPETWPKYKHKTRRIVDRQFKFSLVYLHNENDGLYRRRRANEAEARLLEGEAQ